MLDGVFQLMCFCGAVEAAVMKGWVGAGIKSVELRRGSNIMQAEPNDVESGNQWMWASARLVKSSATLQIVDMTVYDVSTGGVGMFV